VEDQNENAIRRLDRLRLMLTGTAVILVVMIVILLLTDF